MKNSLLIETIDVKTLQKILVDSIKNELETLKQSLNSNKQSEYLSREETAELLKINLSTLHNWSKKGILNPLGLGGRVYYKREEIEKSIVELNKQ